MKPLSFLVCASALIAVAGCNSKPGDAATNTPLNIEQVPPPKGGDWTQVVTETPEGGFLMGNPDAKVKLIEYGSLTCPHCREFDETGVAPLMNTYVKSGQVSYEFRNYVRDAFDLAATLVSRCNGAKGYFPLTRALFKDQQVWVGNVQKTPPAQLEQMQGLPPNQLPLQAAKFAGLLDWAAPRGLAQAKSTQCLTDTAAIDRLVAMTAQATTDYPEFKGTPSFVINGKMLDNTATWDALEPQLRNALGERG
jgi:protein-disulfide isomerase